MMYTSILVSTCLLTNCILPLVTATQQLHIILPQDSQCLLEPCHTLNKIAVNVSRYLNSNTKAIFSPGVHFLNNSTVTIRDVYNLTLVGNDSSTIECFGSAGFIFLNISRLKISKIQFLRCGANLFETTLWQALRYVTIRSLTIPKFFLHTVNSSSLLIILANEVNVSQVTVTASPGIGLLAVNLIANASISQCVFSGNVMNVFFVNKDCRAGISCTNTRLEISNTSFLFGNFCNNNLPIINKLGSGLNIILQQSQYFIEVNISNSSVCENRGYGSNYIFIDSHNSSIHLSNLQIRETLGCNHKSSAPESSGLHIEGRDNGRNTSLDTPQVHIKESAFISNRNGLKLCNVGALVEQTDVCSNEWSGINIMTSLLVLKNANISRNMRSGIYSQESTLCLSGATLIYGNLASDDGGGIKSYNSEVRIQGNTIFTTNEAPSSGGAISGYKSEVYFCRPSSLLNWDEINVLFIHNKAQSAGSIYVLESNVRFFCNATTFRDNQALQHGGAIMAIKSNLTSFGSHVEMYNNRAGEVGGGVLCVRECNLKLDDARIMGNKALKGGGLAFSDRSYMHLSTMSINVTRNYAEQYGGGIYIDTCSEFTQGQPCFYNTDLLRFKYPPSLEWLQGGGSYPGNQPTLPPPLWSSLPAYDLTSLIPLVWLEGNLAGDGGNAIYGAVSGCNNSITNVTLFHIFHVEVFGNASDLSLVSSNPLRVCLCVNNTPDCILTNFNITAYPGQTFSIPAVTVGQWLGATAGVVFATPLNNKDKHVSLSELQGSQKVNPTHCTNLDYSVHSEKDTEDLMLKATAGDALRLFTDQEIKRAVFSYSTSGDIHPIMLHLPIIIHINLQPCPLGFQLESGLCVCSSKLQQHSITDCRINSTGQYIYRYSPVWISAYVRANISGVIVHTHCPFDYCRPDDFYISLNVSDEQCQFNRSGILCGTCNEGLSMMLGSSRCKKCSNTWLLLMLYFTLAGILLVAFLTVFNITISAGTISGLIFYANIVGANQAAFFPKEQGSTFANILYIFIAWLNLDLGIETCFYSGLDAYCKTWLQLLFPINIWVLVFAVIISGHYSSIAAKLSGRNAVPVLATLILLSYAKLLRFIITAFSFTILDIPGGNKKAVWLYDGNVDYLKGKHIPLFLAALAILLTISMPYTGVLLFFQCLQRKSDYKLLCFIKKYKPFFDAYMGPYRDKHRYWTGLLLLVRVGLFLAFSANVLGDPLLNLVFTNTTTLALFLLNTAVGTVYKSKFLDIFEKFFLLNLGCYACATFYVTKRGGHQTIVTLCSVGLTFVAFVGIVCYHTFIALKSSRTLKTLLERVRPPYQPPEEEEVDDNGLECSAEVEVTRSHLQPHYIEFDQLREPVLEYYEPEENQQ